VQGGRKEGVDEGGKEGEERSGSSSFSVTGRSCVGFTGLSHLDEAKRIETETASVGSKRDCRLGSKSRLRLCWNGKCRQP
jgi:hypothetical protein